MATRSWQGRSPHRSSHRVLAMLKGLPLAYDRDLEHEKDRFDAVDTVQLAASGVHRVVAHRDLRGERMQASADVPTSAATGGVLVERGIVS